MLTPENNPVHPCYGCQTCFAEMIDLEEADMGYDTKELRVYGSVSRHNSPKDDRHDDLWAEVRSRIEEIVAEEKYEEIGLWIG